MVGDHNSSKKNSCVYAYVRGPVPVYSNMNVSTSMNLCRDCQVSSAITPPLPSTRTYTQNILELVVYDERNPSPG